MKLLLVLLATVDASERVPRTRVSPLPARLVPKGVSPTDTVLKTLEVALNSQDYSGLQREIEDRANPESPRYAQWLSREEVTDYVQATDEAIAVVSAWMRAAGLDPELNPHRDFLTAYEVPAVTVELLLGAKLYEHYDLATEQTLHLIPGDYSLPAEVASHVSKVFPVHSVPVPRRTRHVRKLAVLDENVAVTAAWPHDCKGLTKSGIITPAATRALYNYTTEGGTVKSTIAAMLPAPIGIDHTAVAYIQEHCGLPQHPLDKFVGTNHEAICNKSKPSEDECVEAALDSQIILTTALGCHTEFWSPEGSFIGMFRKINEGKDVPRVFSMSFGDVETERDDDVPNTEKELAKIVAKGITVVSSSGDNGAGAREKKYYTNYPASSQYVLSVGGTSLKTFGDMQIGEVAVKDGYSSGGFSRLWSAPSWQSKATQVYLNSGAKMPSAGFNRTGRGVPDIAALSGSGDEEWQIRSGTQWAGESGTSTSGPFIASLIAKLNAKRIAKGLGTMGFMNPWLYSKVATTSGALYDVTEGHNTATASAADKAADAFYCTKGWDPVTGLGTPNYKVLEELALQTRDQIIV